MTHHVVTLKHDPREPEIVYLDTPPDLAHTMGGFGPARFVGHNPPIRGVSYAIHADDLGRFLNYANHHTIHVIDARYTGHPVPRRPDVPLPECAQCGQPTRRGHHPEHCPNCGAPWVSVEWGPNG